jgi:hypothetical protein
MKITDIIRSVLDIIDDAEAPAQAEVAVSIEPAEQIADMQKLAGILAVDEPEYANEPNEVIAPVTAAFPAGDDVHSSKNPADIRADSVSMFPDWQARK